MKRNLGFGVMFLTLAAMVSASGFRATGARASLVQGTSGPIGHLGARNIAGFPVDYDRRFSNGIDEYGFAVPAQLSPPDRDQSAADLGREFLELNRDALGILQNVSAFKYVETFEFCDSTRIVRFEQTYAFVPIKTTMVELTLKGQRVVYAELRFIPNVWELPLCQPDVGGQEIIVDIHYLPETTQTIVIVSTEDSVSQGQERSIKDACTNEVLGYEYYLQ